MTFDPENEVIKLCVAGMEQEMNGDNQQALSLYTQAWEKAANSFEKFTAAHYVARLQTTVRDKLKWDELALAYALKMNGGPVRGSYPSLYLNVAKGHEDLGYNRMALRHYESAKAYAHLLPEDEYGNMIKSGIERGLERVKEPPPED